MKNLSLSTLQTLAAAFAAAFIALPSFGQEKAESPVSAVTAPVSAPAAGAPSAADMQKMMAQMMELAKTNENHKLLASLDGNWDYTTKMWMDPNAKPQESKGTAVRKSILDGRYVAMDVTGKMQMPGPDGKTMDMTFKGHSMEGYDNVKKKFIGAWMDNMGTGIVMSEGDYDAATKTFTYTGEMEMMPGMKQKFREVLKLTDKSHMSFEWYEDRGGKEVKTMEINYTRKK